MMPLNISSLKNSRVRFNSTTLLVGNTNSLFPLTCAFIPYFFKRLVLVRDAFRIKITILLVLDNNFMIRRVFMFVICFMFSALASIPSVSPNRAACSPSRVFSIRRLRMPDEGIDFFRLDAFDINPVDDVIDSLLFHLWKFHFDFIPGYQILKFPLKRFTVSVVSDISFEDGFKVCFVSRKIKLLEKHRQISVF